MRDINIVEAQFNTDVENTSIKNFCFNYQFASMNNKPTFFKNPG